MRQHFSTHRCNKENSSVWSFTVKHLRSSSGFTRKQVISKMYWGHSTSPPPPTRTNKNTHAQFLPVRVHFCQKSTGGSQFLPLPSLFNPNSAKTNILRCWERVKEMTARNFQYQSVEDVAAWNAQIIRTINILEGFWKVPGWQADFCQGLYPSGAWLTGRRCVCVCVVVPVLPYIIPNLKRRSSFKTEIRFHIALSGCSCRENAVMTAPPLHIRCMGRPQNISVHTLNFYSQISGCESGRAGGLRTTCVIVICVS